MVPEDLPEVDRVQRDAYVEEFHEDAAVFSDKLQRFPSGCWVCVIDNVVVAYMFSHPARISAPPGLNAVLGDGARPDCYFIHDVAVRESYRRLGLARQLLERGLEVARREGHEVVALISVQNSKGYWERFGFSVLDEPASAVEYVRQSYGESAHYMARR